MMRRLCFFLIALAALNGQSSFPQPAGSQTEILPPSVDAAARIVVFGSNISADGATLSNIDVYAANADGSGQRKLIRASNQVINATGISLSPDGSRAALTVTLPAINSLNEEVHMVDLASGTDRTLVTDSAGCIRPLVECVGCFFSCLHEPHVSPDGGKVLYAASRSQPFYVVNADGTGLLHLPVASGSLASAPQRVISRNGLAAFTSSGLSDPPSPSKATDVYVMNLDGSNIRAVTKFGTNSSIFSRAATISADGSLIAFEVNLDAVGALSGAGSQIWVVRSDGTALHPLTSGPDAASNPSISADGSLVAFNRGGQIYAIRSDGSGLRRLTNFKFSSAHDPVLSDDGSRIAFTLGPPWGIPATRFFNFMASAAVYTVESNGNSLRPVYAPQVLNPDGVTGLAAGAAVAPGGLFSAYGLNLAPDGIVQAERFPLPLSLGGLSLLANGAAVPLLAVSPWQVNAQLPAGFGEGVANFQLRFPGGSLSQPATAPVRTFAPMIFVIDSGTYQAAAFHAGTAIPADAAHPAKAGEILEIYATGLGPTIPPVPAGTPAPASPVARTTVQPDVFIANQPAKVLFSGLTPGLAGVYQINAVVPSGLGSLPQAPVTLRVGQADLTGYAVIAVQ